MNPNCLDMTVTESRISATELSGLFNKKTAGVQKKKKSHLSLIISKTSLRRLHCNLKVNFLVPWAITCGCKSQFQRRQEP